MTPGHFILGIDDSPWDRMTRTKLISTGIRGHNCYAFTHGNYNHALHICMNVQIVAGVCPCRGYSVCWCWLQIYKIHSTCRVALMEDCGVVCGLTVWCRCQSPFLNFSAGMRTTSVVPGTVCPCLAVLPGREQKLAILALMPRTFMPCHLTS